MKRSFKKTTTKKHTHTKTQKNKTDRKRNKQKKYLKKEKIILHMCTCINIIYMYVQVVLTRLYMPRSKLSILPIVCGEKIKTNKKQRSNSSSSIQWMRSLIIKYFLFCITHIKKQKKKLYKYLVQNCPLPLSIALYLLSNASSLHPFQHQMNDGL